MKVKIIKPGINGEGIGYIERTPVFVPGALVDEEVDIRIDEKKPRYSIGKLNRVLVKSEDRVRARCAIQDECGACPLMIAQYAKQLDYKMILLKQSLIKYAQVNPKYIQPIVANSQVYGYRNQCKLPFHMENGYLVTGMFIPGSNFFYEVKKCIIHEDGLETIRKAILRVLNTYGCDAYDYHTKKGMRSLVIRGFNGKYQCTLVTGEDELDPAMIEELTSIEGMYSLWQSIHTVKKSPDVFGAKMILLAKERYLPLKLDELSLQLSPRSFFQLNTTQASVLYKKIAEMVPAKSELIVEAYSGVGAISLYIKDKAKEIIGIESIKDAVINANQNARDNHAKNVSFVCADAADKLEYISKKRPIDVLIVDPPRSGLDELMLSCILKSKIKTIIYISCNPATLGKNLAVLNSRYKVQTIVPVDMFSHTAHIETIVKLTRMR